MCKINQNLINQIQEDQIREARLRQQRKDLMEFDNWYNLNFDISEEQKDLKLEIIKMRAYLKTLNDIVSKYDETLTDMEDTIDALS